MSTLSAVDHRIFVGYPQPVSLTSYFGFTRRYLEEGDNMYLPARTCLIVSMSFELEGSAILNLESESILEII